MPELRVNYSVRWEASEQAVVVYVGFDGEDPTPRFYLYTLFDVDMFALEQEVDGRDALAQTVRLVGANLKKSTSFLIP